MNDQPRRSVFRSSRVTPFSDIPVSSESQPAPSWKLVRCENGLRFFEEVSSGSKLPVVKAVGVVKGPAECVFDEIMNYGPERFQWDHTIETASIVEIVDDHSDILHLCLRQDSRWLRPRDLCICRYWKREENGSYTIFYRSTSKHPVQSGHVRATVHSGGYVVTPLLTSGKPKSIVESVFEIDVGGWPSWLGPGFSDYSAYLRRNLLGVIAGLREYFATQRVDVSISFFNLTGLVASGTIASHKLFLDNDVEDFHDARTDEFSDTVSEIGSPKLAAEVHRNGSGLEKELSLSKLSGSLTRGPLVSGRNSYAEPEPSSFKIRSKDGLLIPARDPHFKLVAVDWYKSKHRLDNVSGYRSIVQEAPRDVFFFTFNLQVPHSGLSYSLIFYFASRRKPVEGSLLHRYINGNDEFRRQRLLLSPSIPEGSWIVRRAVGSKTVLLGQILECNHFSGPNYSEVDVNMDSSAIVRGVMSIVFGYMSALVVDMGFSLRAETDDELPEEFLGAVRCSRLDLSHAVMVS